MIKSRTNFLSSIILLEFTEELSLDIGSNGHMYVYCVPKNTACPRSLIYLMWRVAMYKKTRILRHIVSKSIGYNKKLTAELECLVDRK